MEKMISLFLSDYLTFDNQTIVAIVILTIKQSNNYCYRNFDNQTISEATQSNNHNNPSYLILSFY